MRRPCLALSSSCLASNLLCFAKASSGDNSGGASPATWSRGDLSGLETEADDFDLRSRNSGLLCDMMILCCEGSASKVPYVVRVNSVVGSILRWVMVNRTLLDESDTARLQKVTRNGELT